MNYFLSEQQIAIQEVARQIAEEVIKPIRAKYDESAEFPWEAVKAMKDGDLFGVYIPEEYGGMGGGILDLVLAVEELSRACGGISLSLAATALGVIPILLFGTEEQKKKFIPPCAKGEKLAAFGITEPTAGSDAGGIQSTATEDGNHFVLNGTKQWVTNGEVAEIYSTVFITDRDRGARGATAFIIEKGTPGFSFGKHYDKMGIRASATTELIFEDCRVPKENMLGKQGQGFLVALKTFDHARPGVAAQALGIAQGAFDEAVRYSKERKQFGRSISTFQGIQFMLADMATHIEAARALTYAVAKGIDSGLDRFPKESSMSKLLSSDVAMKVTTDAVQIFGGYGYMKEYPVEKMMRDAKITQIYEGTNQIQRSVIAQNILKELLKKK